MQAAILKEGVVETYDPLNGKDLSEVDDLRATLSELNMFLHRSCLPKTEELRLDFPVIQSRSASVVSGVASPPGPSL